MSLIERAVEKISVEAGHAPVHVAGSGVTTPTASGGPAPSLIEDAVRAAAGGLSPPQARATPGIAITAGAARPAPAVPAPPAIEAAPPGPMAPAVAAPSAPRLDIQLAALRERGFITPSGSATPLSQQFRVIKRPLLANAFGRGTSPMRHGKRVMVTSAFPGEGKSFCAINLAMSIAAERDHKVLLVDADVARPSVPRELRIETGPGLMDWLIDGTLDIGSLVHPTNIETLSILPAGRSHEHATEYIASDGMNRLLDELSDRFPDSLLVFDSPPLLVTTEARVLASHMGQIVLVVEAGKTRRDAVNEAIATIEGCEIVGLVLNKAASERSGSNYGYQGYGYGSSAQRG
jgi:protein-tyrosine kinase